MTNIDQFESIFKKADKSQFELEDVDLSDVLILSDSDEATTRQFEAKVADFLDTTSLDEPINWHRLCGHEHRAVSDVLERLESLKPDLIVTFRNLHAPATDYPYTLGVYLDVLSQTTEMPVLVLPSPHRNSAIPTHTLNVMAIADHLTGDNKLVSYAAKLTQPNGKLMLAHVEDQSVFERYISVISKIASIDTDEARAAIMEQLLGEPKDFIHSCREEILRVGLPIEVEELVTIGHSLRDYARLIGEHEVNLLVLNTKQEDQLAMHGLAYPLCVELRDTPILML